MVFCVLSYREKKVQFSENVSFSKCLKQVWFFPNIGVKFFANFPKLSKLIFQKLLIKEGGKKKRVWGLYYYKSWTVPGLALGA